MYCNKCGRPIPDGSVFCNSCGTKQAVPNNAPQPQVRPVQRPPVQQETDQMPKSYYTDSWLLFLCCIIYGLIRVALGLTGGNKIHIYKGFIACLTACVFIPSISVMKNPTGTLLIKIVVAIALILLI